MEWNATFDNEELHDATNLTLQDVLLTHCFTALMVDRIVTPIWYVIGITGNVISAVIWLQWRMRQNCPSAVYLSALSINDTVFLLLHPLQELKYAWFLRSIDHPVLCETYAMLFLVTQYLAPVIVLAFSVDRFIAVCCPFQKKRYCTMARAVKVVIVCVTSCILLGAVQPYLWTYDRDVMECTVREEAQRYGQRSLWSVWSWISELVVFLLVPLLVFAFNVMVIREIYHLSRSVPDARRASFKIARHLMPPGVAATNAMLLLVSFYVIFTTLPATIVYVLAIAFPAGDLTTFTSLRQVASDPMWRRYIIYISLKKVIDEICLSHYACNIFLFAATGIKFRCLVKRILLCRLTEPMTSEMVETANSSRRSIRRTTEQCMLIISRI